MEHLIHSNRISLILYIHGEECRYLSHGDLYRRMIREKLDGISSVNCHSISILIITSVEKALLATQDTLDRRDLENILTKLPLFLRIYLNREKPGKQTGICICVLIAYYRSM